MPLHERAAWVGSGPPEPDKAVLVLRRDAVVDERTGWSAPLSPEVVRWLNERQQAGDTWVPTRYLGSGLVGLARLRWTAEDDPAPVVPMRGLPVFPRRRPPKLAFERLFERAKDLDVVALGGDHYAVESQSEPGSWHRVVVEEHDGYLATLCSCRSARFRPRDRSVACAHAAAVINRLCCDQAPGGPR